ncbi:MAG: hypothetical protein EU547_01565 [Promethearchaeota archaeon]|nr:MAG: hypothetical protein EU547_01565 [Candidatus Lokiarchaeota archaeon]
MNKNIFSKRIKKQNIKKRKILSFLILTTISLSIIGFVGITHNMQNKSYFKALSSSEWAPNGTTICTSEGNQLNTQLISDGNGGAIITWVDERNPLSEEDIYAQKINSEGETLWEHNGTIICNNEDRQISPQIVSDDSGGAIIVWYDNRAGNWDIYAQRVNSAGVVQWNTNGTIVCNKTSTQNMPEAIKDGEGGAIITWYDDRNGNNDIYVQRIDSNGDLQWDINGIVICDNQKEQSLPQITSDGEGGAIITWRDNRTENYDIYAQKINSNGQTQWSSNGTLICNDNSIQVYPQLISDGLGGAIICWYNYFNGDSDIYAQRVNSAGVVQWEDNGTIICNALDRQEGSQITSDGEGGAIISWEDLRSGDFDVYAQKITSTGVIQWDVNGTVICNATDKQDGVHLTSDGEGGAIITWFDERNTDSDIYAQRVNSAGEIQWNTNGNLTCNALNDQTSPRIIRSSAGKAIIAWRDTRNGNMDIYAELISYSIETLDGGGNGGIPGFNPLILGIISIITLIIAQNYKRKRN